MVSLESMAKVVIELKKSFSVLQNFGEWEQ